MAEVNSYNVTDSSNTARYPEGQAPSTVNNGGRAGEGIVARWHKDTNGSLVTTGSANAYLITTNTADTLYDGQTIVFDANFANTGAATLNVTNFGGSAQGAKNILKRNDIALASGDIEANQKVAVVYDGTSFQMLSPAAVAELRNLVEDTTPQLGGDLDLNGNNLDFPTTANVSDCLDEDNMSSDSATKLATQQSIKAYADALTGRLTAGTELVQNPAAVNATVTQSHSLGAEPTFYKSLFECITTDAGWAVGDRLEVGSLSGSSAGANIFVIYGDATNTVLVMNQASVMEVPNKSTRVNTALTYSKWKISVTPYLLA